VETTSRIDGFLAEHLALAQKVARRVARRAGVRDDHLVLEAAHAGVAEACRALEGRAEWAPDVAVRTVVTRRTLDLVRRERSRARREALAEREAIDPAPGPLEAAARDEVRERVREALGELAPEQRRWVEAFFLHGRAAAARELGMPKSSFRSRFERVCESLRYRLRPIATAGLVLALGLAGERSGAIHASVGAFAVRSERPGANATVGEFRAEATRFRARPTEEAPRDLTEVERSAAALAIRAGRAFVSTI
jgi:DNA-directed RNA polymerase specialized sigma24 family protein